MFWNHWSRKFVPQKKISTTEISKNNFATTLQIAPTTSHNLYPFLISRFLLLQLRCKSALLQRHAFIHPARAVVKVMSMTTGELDYDDIFHHKEGEEEIAFPLISFPLWVIFLVMMPVLLNNYLVRWMPDYILKKRHC